eukprot:403377420
MKQKRSELDAKMHRRMRNNEVQSSISLPLTERFQNIDQLDQNQSEFQAKTESQCYNQLTIDNQVNSQQYPLIMQQSLKGEIEILYSTFQHLQKGENVGDTFAQNLKIIKHMLGKLDQLSLDYSYQNGLIDIIVTVIRNELHNGQLIESDLTVIISLFSIILQFISIDTLLNLTFHDFNSCLYLKESYQFLDLLGQLFNQINLKFFKGSNCKDNNSNLVKKSTSLILLLGNLIENDFQQMQLFNQKFQLQGVIHHIINCTSKSLTGEDQSYEQRAIKKDCIQAFHASLWIILIITCSITNDLNEYPKRLEELNQILSNLNKQELVSLMQTQDESIEYLVEIMQNMLKTLENDQLHNVINENSYLVESPLLWLRNQANYPEEKLRLCTKVIKITYKFMKRMEGINQLASMFLGFIYSNNIVQSIAYNLRLDQNCSMSNQKISVYAMKTFVRLLKAAPKYEQFYLTMQIAHNQHLSDFICQQVKRFSKLNRYAFKVSFQICESLSRITNGHAPQQLLNYLNNSKILDTLTENLSNYKILDHTILYDSLDYLNFIYDLCESLQVQLQNIHINCNVQEQINLLESIMFNMKEESIQEMAQQVIIQLNQYQDQYCDTEINFVSQTNNNSNQHCQEQMFII